MFHSNGNVALTNTKLFKGQPNVFEQLFVAIPAAIKNPALGQTPPVKDNIMAMAPAPLCLTRTEIFFLSTL